MKTNTLSKDEQLLKQYYSRYGGFWIYEGMLDYCYLVNPYFHRSRIIDEMQNNFRTLVSEYPSGMGVNSKLASECWHIKQEYIVPGNGAAELIKTLMENLKGKVGVVRPTFEEYPLFLRMGHSAIMQRSLLSSLVRILLISFYSLIQITPRVTSSRWMVFTN